LNHTTVKLLQSSSLLAIGTVVLDQYEWYNKKILGWQKKKKMLLNGETENYRTGIHI
jgi:hypothetical protein